MFVFEADIVKPITEHCGVVVDTVTIIGARSLEDAATMAFMTAPKGHWVGMVRVHSPVLDALRKAFEEVH